MLISQDSRRVECEPTAEHHHVWLDKGMVLIAQPPRFNTRQGGEEVRDPGRDGGGQLRGEAVCAPVSVHGEAEAEAEAEEVSPLWANTVGGVAAGRVGVTLAELTKQRARDPVLAPPLLEVGRVLVDRGGLDPPGC